MRCAWHSGGHRHEGTVAPAVTEPASLCGEGDEATDYDQDRAKKCHESGARSRSDVQTSGSQHVVPNNSRSLTWELAKDARSPRRPRRCFNRPCR